jgi:hypothetical protein
MEQVGLPFHPTHVNTPNQHDRRAGYADLLHYPQRYRVQWQLWTAGTTRLLLWGDPEYVRRFAESARLYDGNSFEINEMLATRMLGEPSDEAPLPILNSRYRYYDYEFERYWAFYRMWGRLTYNPQTAPEVWESGFENRSGEAGIHVMKALETASGVLPRIVAAAYRYDYFPTTRGWAEMNRQDSLQKFATEENSDIQQFENARAEARSRLQGTDTPMRRPPETASWFTQTANAIMSELALAGKTIGPKGGTSSPRRRRTSEFWPASRATTRPDCPPRSITTYTESRATRRPSTRPSPVRSAPSTRGAKSWQPPATCTTITFRSAHGPSVSGSTGRRNWRFSNRISPRSKPSVPKRRTSQGPFRLRAIAV